VTAVYSCPSTNSFETLKNRHRPGAGIVSTVFCFMLELTELKATRGALMRAYRLLRKLNSTQTCLITLKYQ